MLQSSQNWQQIIECLQFSGSTRELPLYQKKRPELSPCTNGTGGFNSIQYYFANLSRHLQNMYLFPKKTYELFDKRLTKLHNSFIGTNIFIFLKLIKVQTVSHNDLFSNEPPSNFARTINKLSSPSFSLSFSFPSHSLFFVSSMSLLNFYYLLFFFIINSYFCALVNKFSSFR